MNTYEELAAQLKDLAKKIKDNTAALGDKKLAMPAAVLKRAADRFEAHFTDLVEGRDPAMTEFQDLIKSPSAKKHLDEEGLKILAKRILGKALPYRKEESLGDYRKRFIEAVSETKKITRAVEGTREFLSEAATPKPGPKNEQALLAELYRIGGLSDEELQAELNGRLQDEKLIRALAAAAHVRVRETSTLEKIRRDVVKFAKRAHGNLA